MSTVISRDGTRITYDRVGSGPAVILVDGSLSSRSAGLNAGLAAQLATQFSAYIYDRRGRGDSGDTLPYAVEREIEDIDGLVEAAGGAAHLYGVSSGGVLALDAANRLGTKITRLAVYEAPFVVDDARPPIPDGYPEQMQKLITQNRRGEAIDLFMSKGIGMPGWMVFMMRFLPFRAGQKALAHTLPYDVAVMGDTQSGKPLRAQRWASITAPTLVVAGGKSRTWMRNGQLALADILPNAEHRVLDGQMHIVKAEALAPMLIHFFSDGTRLPTEPDLAKGIDR